MEELIIRPATPDDAGVFRDLVLYASPEYESLFGNKTLPLMEKLFREKANLFSHEHAQVAERGGEPCGLMVGYDKEAREKQELETARLVWSDAWWEVILNLPFLLLSGGRVGQIFPGEKYVSHLVVYPERRSGGVGAALLEAFEAGALSDGKTVSSLETKKDNIGAIKFYTRHGYEITGEMAVSFRGKKRTYLRLTKSIA